MSRRALAVTAAVALAAVAASHAAAVTWLTRQLGDAFHAPLIPEVPHP